MWKNREQVWGSIFEFCATGCIRQCCAKLFQLCPTLCHPVDRSLPGSSLHRILQVRILECTPKLSQLYPKYKIKVLKSRWGMFVHFPSTPSYPKPVILQILLRFCEHAVSLIRHLCNLGTAFIPSVCSTFMIQQIAQKRKPSWVMLCNFEYLERGDIFHSVSCSSLQVFPCCHGKGFMKQIQPKRSRFSMAPEISAQPPSPTWAQQRTSPALVKADLSSVDLGIRCLSYFASKLLVKCHFPGFQIKDSWYSLLETKVSRGPHL